MKDASNIQCARNAELSDETARVRYLVKSAVRRIEAPPDLRRLLRTATGLDFEHQGEIGNVEVTK
jgi:hypothetical protein